MTRKSMDEQRYSVQVTLGPHHKAKRMYLSKYTIYDYDIRDGTTDIQDVMMTEAEALNMYQERVREALGQQGFEHWARVLLVKHSRWAPYPNMAVLLSTVINEPE